MTFFFFVIGLEARREFDLGELRDRRGWLRRFSTWLVWVRII
jgi:Na+/H+ antiporter NhaA